MGKDPNEARERSKSRRPRRKTTGVADWAAVSGDAIRNAICAAGKCGGAIRFGYSSDGGAYGVGIYGDGQPYTEWVRPDEDVEEFLESVVELFEEIADDNASKATGQKKGSTAHVNGNK